MTPHENVPPGIASRASGRSARFSGRTAFRWPFRVSLLVAAILFALVGKSQTPDISSPSIAFSRISVEQGLSNNTVYAITQDKLGYIWIGTGDGLNRYDGKQCLVYRAGTDSASLCDNLVWSLFSDWDGSLWVGTNHGLSRFDPKTVTFKNYFNIPGAPGSLSHNEVREIYRDHAGTLWVGTKRGLNRYEPTTGRWTRFLPTNEDSLTPGDNFVKACFEDNNNNLWIESGNFSMAGGGIFKFDRAHGSFTRLGDGTPEGSPSDFCAIRAGTSPGNLWVCTSAIQPPRSTLNLPVALSWVSFYPLTSFESPRRVLSEPPRGYGLFRVSEDHHGALWFGDFIDGLFRYDKRTGTLSRFPADLTDQGTLSSQHINVVFVDRSGLLWVGTDDDGIAIGRTTQFRFRHTLGDSLEISGSLGRTFVDSDNNLWVNLIRLDQKVKRARYVLGEIYQTDIAQDKEGTIWLGNVFSIVRYVPGQNVGMHVWNLPNLGRDEVSTSLFIDSKDNFWVGTQGGIYRVNHAMTTSSYFLLDTARVMDIFSGRVTTIYEDKSGFIWVATATGLNRIEPETGTIIRFFHKERDSTSISSNFCTGVLEDHFGTIWVSTTEGLDRFNPGDRSFVRVLRAPLGRIVSDRKGRFWFGSCGKYYGPSGIISMYDPATSTFQSFNASDGLPHQTINGWPDAMLQSGELVFGTHNGLVVFHPDSVAPLDFVPPIVVTGLRSREQPIVLRTSSGLLREATLDHENNVFTVSFAALSYETPEYNQYAYQLAGFDNEWSYCGNRTEVAYTNLDPGDYTFRVKGSNHDGVWNDAGTTLAIVIRPAYWQTWWFKGLMVIAMVGLGGSVAGYAERARGKRKIERLEREHALERERARISQDMHDEVGSSLSEIAILSELVKRDLRKPESAEIQVQQISDRAAELIDNVSEIVWAMNPKNDTLDNLVAHLRRHSVKYMSLAEIHCSISAPDIIHAYYVTAEVRRNVFLVVKEALHNIVKHSGASEVTIGVALTELKMEASICDNGRGFVSGEVRGSGNGLANMQKRMADIGGEFRIESTPGAGTQITIAAPLTDARRSP